MPSDTDHCPHFSRGHCTVCLELASVGEALEVLQAELQRVRGQRDRLVEAGGVLDQLALFGHWLRHEIREADVPAIRTGKFCGRLAEAIETSLIQPARAAQADIAAHP
jgi:hypothetical protein